MRKRNNMRTKLPGHSKQANASSEAHGQAGKKLYFDNSTTDTKGMCTPGQAFIFYSF